MPNVCLTIAYDGSRYVGWQVQPNGPTIQVAIESAIERVTGQPTQLLAAGRTDSGVHAFGQVANFHTTASIPERNWRPAIQTFLPDDIVIRDARFVPETFHATFSALRKRYRYLILNSRIAFPFLRHYTHFVRRPLDAPAMHAAAQCLVGTHDFRSFETDWPNKATSVRTVAEVTIGRMPLWPLWTLDSAAPSRLESTAALQNPENAGPPACDPELAGTPLVVLDIVADGFLYNMVRSIVGSLVHVGHGSWSTDDFARVLTAQNRSVAGNTAPPQGLYLLRVDYDLNASPPAAAAD